MPTLFLIILLSSVVQPGFWWLLAITVLFGWMALVGVVRAEFLRTRNYDYIRAAQALGQRPPYHFPTCCLTPWSRP
jgi:microcin C transport system permease protein